MRVVSLIVIKEAGQIRSYAVPSGLTQTPEWLIWGPSEVQKIDSHCTDARVWPSDQDLSNAVIVDHDNHLLSIAGADTPFFVPYQLELFTRMLAAPWQGYTIQQLPLRGVEIAKTAGMPMPTIDDQLGENLMRKMHDYEYDAEEEDEDDEHFDYASPNEDFRQLVKSGNVRSGTQRKAHLEAMHALEDQAWWVSARINSENDFQHFVGDFVLQTIQQIGGEFVDQISGLAQAKIPEESECERGLVIDAVDKTIHVWAFPRGLPPWFSFDDSSMSDWTVQQWHTNGFRKQLKHTGASKSYIEKSDTHFLAQLIPMMNGGLQLKAVMGEIKTGVRKFVWKGYGCLAMFLAIPTGIACLVAGSWKGPIAFASVIWLMIVIAVQLLLRRVKKNFQPMLDVQERAMSAFPSLGPESKEKRKQIIDECLIAAGLPSYEEVMAYEDPDEF